MTKIDVFKNIVYQIKEWHKAKCKSGEKLHTLKLIKLFFFIVSVSPKLIQFFSFHCMPYGHFDRDLWDMLKKGYDFGFFTIDSGNVVFKDSDPYFFISYDINNEILKSIEFIEKQEPKFIQATSFDLVDLNRQWFCFKNYYKKAEQDKTYISKVSNEVILKEDKYFYIPDLHRWYN